MCLGLLKVLEVLGSPGLGFESPPSQHFQTPRVQGLITLSPKPQTVNPTPQTLEYQSPESLADLQDAGCTRICRVHDVSPQRVTVLCKVDLQTSHIAGR